jgi:hypothetical protein
VLEPLGAEWWAEPVEQPADRDTIETYDVEPQVLERWREARNVYLSARAALVGQVERQGWRAPARAPATRHVDILFEVRLRPWRPRSSRSRTTSAAASATANGCSASMGRGCCASRSAVL